MTDIESVSYYSGAVRSYMEDVHNLKDSYTKSAEVLNRLDWLVSKLFQDYVRAEAEIERLRSALKDCVAVFEDHPDYYYDEPMMAFYCRICSEAQGKPHKPTCRWKLTLDKAKATMGGEGNG